MSYRNPQQVVDTQSIQHVQRMQQQVTGSFVNMAEKIGARNRAEADQKNKEIKDYKSRLKKNYDAAADATEALKGQIPSLELDSINDQLDIYADLSVKDPTTLTKKERNMMRHVKGLPAKVTSLLQQVTSFEEAHSNRVESEGIEGGYASDVLGVDDKARDVLFRRKGAVGKMELNFQLEDDRSSIGVDVYLPKNEPPTYDSDGNVVLADKPITMYPGEFEEQMEGTTIANVTKEVIDPYVENFEAQSKTLDYWKNNGKVKSFTVNGKTTTYYTPDTDGIKKDMITSIEDGFNSVFSKKQIIAYHNNVLYKNDPGKSLKYDDDLSDDQKKEIATEIADRRVKSDPRFLKQYIADKSSDNNVEEFNGKAQNASTTVAYLTSEVESMESASSVDDFPRGAIQFGKEKGDIIGYELVGRPNQEGQGIGKVKINIGIGTGQNRLQVSETIDFSKPKDKARFIESLIRAGQYGGADKESMYNMVRANYSLSDFNKDGVFTP